MLSRIFKKYIPVGKDNQTSGPGPRASDLQDLKLLLGQIRAGQLSYLTPADDIHKAEFRVFSQFGDDGIIQYLIRNLEPLPHIFIEFGVSNFIEANTRFLLLNNNWSGLVMDSSEACIDTITGDEIYWRHDLMAKTAFINAENINFLIKTAGMSGEIGLLHIDIDGNDYWVWKALSVVKPVIVIIEYNSVFGKVKPITIPYQPEFDRTKAHYSNLYFGASISALCKLSKRKGYSFIGSNSHGNNAYFIRSDRLGKFKSLKPQNGYVRSIFRESRDESGRLTYLSGEARLRQIKGMPVYNINSKKIELL